MATSRKHTFPQSVRLALFGFLNVLKTQRNFKIHLLASFAVILLGGVLGLTKTEWLLILLMVFGVLSAETFNSAVEEICNFLDKKLQLGYEETKLPRDIAAGAVLLLAIASVILGLAIFLPRLLSLYY